MSASDLTLDFVSCPTPAIVGDVDSPLSVVIHLPTRAGIFKAGEAACAIGILIARLRNPAQGARGCST